MLKKPANIYNQSWTPRAVIIKTGKKSEISYPRYRRSLKLRPVIRYVSAAACPMSRPNDCCRQIRRDPPSTGDLPETRRRTGSGEDKPLEPLRKVVLSETSGVITSSISDTVEVIGRHRSACWVSRGGCIFAGKFPAGISESDSSRCCWFLSRNFKLFALSVSFPFTRRK